MVEFPKENFPVSAFGEINRTLFVAFDECKMDEEIRAYQAANRGVASAAKLVKKLFEILRKEERK